MDGWDLATVWFIHRAFLRANMAAFKQTSQPLNIGASVDLADGTPQTVTVTLPLSSLDREIFVVTDIQMEWEPLAIPAAPGNTVTLLGSVNKTATGFTKINNPDCIGSFQAQLQLDAAGNTLSNQVSRSPDESSTGTVRDYIGVIATPDFRLHGSYASTAGGKPNREISVRITGYRAVASADVYAALVTEELNN